MRIAAFESEPEANATAVMLRERGYDSRVITVDDESYEANLREFFGEKPRTFEPHAFVISDTAEYEPFIRAVNRHYGFAIRGGTD